MALASALYPYTLDFKFPAGTSRGILKQKETFLIKIWDENQPAIVGWGECGPLKGLSVDDIEGFDKIIDSVLKKLDGKSIPSNKEAIYELVLNLVSYQYPSLRFAIETALLDLLHGGKKKIFNNDFYNKSVRIPINGLIWMGHTDAMFLQIHDKVEEGFDCIKMKVGSLDFEKEVDILNYVRRKYYNKELLLRVDANGAFKPEEALYKLNVISKYNIHSIEQPIAPGLTKEMAELCRQSPVAIALDEELINVNTIEEKRALLEQISPQYIIIKPTLLGGLASSEEWIKLAESLEIGWWITSALESNIGLNAICQFAYEMNAKSYQGLGTGKLYHNNFESPLTINKGHINYDQNVKWDISQLKDGSEIGE